MQGVPVSLLGLCSAFCASVLNKELTPVLLHVCCVAQDPKSPLFENVAELRALHRETHRLPLRQSDPECAFYQYTRSPRIRFSG